MYYEGENVSKEKYILGISKDACTNMHSKKYLLDVDVTKLNFISASWSDAPSVAWVNKNICLF